MVLSIGFVVFIESNHHHLVACNDIMQHPAKRTVFATRLQTTIQRQLNNSQPSQLARQCLANCGMLATHPSPNFPAEQAEGRRTAPGGRRNDCEKNGGDGLLASQPGCRLLQQGLQFRMIPLLDYAGFVRAAIYCDRQSCADLHYGAGRGALVEDIAWRYTILNVGDGRSEP
jgi:hypothetical protein